MIKKSKLGKEFFFNEEEHVYTNKAGHRLISASQLVELFVPEFDPDGAIAERCARKEGITVEQILERWAQINREACDHGSAVHTSLENYINTGLILDDDPNRKFVLDFQSLGIDRENCVAEYKACSLKDRLAGTIDLIEFETKTVVNIWDFKTNKEIKKFNPFGDTMLFPFEHRYNVNLYHYQLQLNIYAYMLERMGYWVDKLNLIHFDRKKQRLTVYPLPKNDDNVKLMLDYWKNSGYSIEKAKKNIHELHQTFVKINL